MASCNNPAILTKAQCVDPNDMNDATIVARRHLKGGGAGIVWDGSSPLIWSNPASGSFDDFGSAMRLLYVMSSGDQWEIPMFRMMGVREVDHAPVRNDFSPMAIFSIAWMFIGYIFAINLFVGVVVDTFSRMQQEENGSAIMTHEQQQWVGTMKAMVSKTPSKAPREPKQWLRKLCFRLVGTRCFEAFITVVIIANIILMACDYWRIEEDVQILHAYENAMDAFSMIYYVECVVKIIAMGTSGYFGDSWYMTVLVART